jgi:superfamily II DNA helicase RecQ
MNKDDLQKMPSIVIYCLTVNETEEIVKWLKKLSPPTATSMICRYHRGIENENDRENLVQEFVKDDSYIKILVTTTALGCGIDKKNISVVVLWGMQKDITESIQIMGRAARDPETLPNGGVILICYYQKQLIAVHDSSKKGKRISLVFIFIF